MRRQPHAGVEVPGAAGDGVRGHGEVEQRERRAGLDQPQQLPHRGERIVEVAQEVAGRERVERPLAELERLGAAEPQLDAVGHAGLGDALAGAVEHLRRLVDADDAAAVARHEPAGDRARSRGDVEHRRVAAHRHVADEVAPPARILREREDRRPAVVIAAERSEEGTRRIVDRTVPVHLSSSAVGKDATRAVGCELGTLPDSSVRIPVHSAACSMQSSSAAGSPASRPRAS